MSLNYCSAADGVAIRGKGTVGDVQQWYLDSTDALIENWTGQGYKGTQRTYLAVGTGNTLIKLPRKASSIISVVEGDIRTVGTIEYRLDRTGKTITRKQNSLIPQWNYVPATWSKNIEYLITYLEPDINQMPELYRWTAANCIAEILGFIEKNKEFGVALTASDQASAGRVSTGASTSFPPTLAEELKRIIRTSLPKKGL